jgi:hypothetical protein
MTVIKYRATVDGGIMLTHGILTTIAVEILPTINKGRRVYVRAVTDPSVCVQLQYVNDELVLTPTRWGAPTDDHPAWADSLRNLLSI